MGAVHVRTPKNFVLEERTERYADAIETNPEAYVGDWRKACAPAGSEPFEHLHLDLGCGKGTYLVERAHREPDTLFIGMDQSPSASPMPRRKSANRGYPTHSSCPEAPHRCHSCLPQASSMPSPLTFPRRSPRPSTLKNDSSMSTI